MSSPSNDGPEHTTPDQHGPEQSTPDQQVSQGDNSQLSPDQGTEEPDSDTPADNTADKPDSVPNDSSTPDAELNPDGQPKPDGQSDSAQDQAPGKDQVPNDLPADQKPDDKQSDDKDEPEAHKPDAEHGDGPSPDSTKPEPESPNTSKSNDGTPNNNQADNKAPDGDTSNDDKTQDSDAENKHKNSAGYTLTPPPGAGLRAYATIAHHLTQIGPNTSAVIEVDWNDGGTHRFNVVNHNGRTSWLDAQTGQEAELHPDNVAQIKYWPNDANPNEVPDGHSDEPSPDSTKPEPESPNTSKSNDGTPDNNQADNKAPDGDTSNDDKTQDSDAENKHKNSAGYTLTPPPGAGLRTYATIAHHLTQIGPNTSAVIEVDWNDGGTHRFNVVNHNGRTSWLDAQTGQEAELHPDNVAQIKYWPNDANPNEVPDGHSDEPSPDSTKPEPESPNTSKSNDGTPNNNQADNKAPDGDTSNDDKTQDGGADNKDKRSGGLTLTPSPSEGLLAYVTIANYLAQIGPGASAVVEVNWNDGGTHQFNAVVDHNGGTSWADAQTGQEAELHSGNVAQIRFWPHDANGNEVPYNPQSKSPDTTKSDDRTPDNNQADNNQADNKAPDGDTSNDDKTQDGGADNKDKRSG
ncbi:toxin glutamine deamidase domain-containing protein, partial [Streptomyces sp. NPDC057579]|uniref:toxin glutamine deamidase domain-containing protein n=1 Tax=Streptomyces sp. NPDC057579 TaxID=3346172 RepID=UPI00368773C5